MNREISKTGVPTVITISLTCKIGDNLNIKFFRACFHEFVASFSLLWVITAVSSGIGFLPTIKISSNNHYLATATSAGTSTGNFVAKYGGPGMVLNALQQETGLSFGFDRSIGYGLVYGFGVMFLTYSICHISGAHINPMVTLALAITGNCSWSRAVGYWIFQFGGAIGGAAWLRLALGPSNYLSGLLHVLPISAGQGFLLEFWGSCFVILPYLFFSPWASQSYGYTWSLNRSAPSSMGPIAAGCALLVASIAIHPFTGCALNPARAAAGAIFEIRRHNFPFAVYGFPTHWWIYWIGPLGAAIITPLIYIGIVGTASNTIPHEITEKETQKEEKYIRYSNLY